MRAVRQGDKSGAALLLSGATDHDLWVLLRTALDKGESDGIVFLLENKASHKHALHYALSRERATDEELIRDIGLLLKFGADVNEEQGGARGELSRQPLYWAIDGFVRPQSPRRTLAPARVLLERGATAVNVLGQVLQDRVTWWAGSSSSQQMERRQQAIRLLEDHGRGLTAARHASESFAWDTGAPLSALTDDQLAAILEELCRAYAADDGHAVSTLEARATAIGEFLDRRGGVAEMRRVFGLVPSQAGRRTLEMHWGGIGEWRG